MATKEWLNVINTKDIETGEPVQTSRLKIFRNCNNLIRDIPQVQIDAKNPNDVATEPHEPTHSVDSLRYFCVNFTYNSEKQLEKKIQLPAALRTEEDYSMEGMGMVEW